MSHYIYILKCNDETLYVGCTNDLKRRLKEHNHTKKGASYTKFRRPVEIVYTETFENFGNARRRESEIKSWRREQKLSLIKALKIDLRGLVGNGSSSKWSALHTRTGNRGFGLL